MKYFSKISEEEAEEALKLPSSKLIKNYMKPEGCLYPDALDKNFGCIFIFRSEFERLNITRRCEGCTCGIKSKI